jgi:hypothetical protein
MRTVLRTASLRTCILGATCCVTAYCVTSETAFSVRISLRTLAVKRCCLSAHQERKKRLKPLSRLCLGAYQMRGYLRGINVINPTSTTTATAFICAETAV